MEHQDLFETKYEENYLRRELGDVVNHPDVAITELVANAYDAGASKVEIIIPEEFDQTLSEEDDGIGMTADHIKNRWMMMRCITRAPTWHFLIGTKALEGRLLAEMVLVGMDCFVSAILTKLKLGVMEHVPHWKLA